MVAAGNVTCDASARHKYWNIVISWVLNGFPPFFLYNWHNILCRNKLKAQINVYLSSKIPKTWKYHTNPVKPSGISTPNHTRTCGDPLPVMRIGVPDKMSPKTWKMVEKWVRYTQFWWFSQNWLYLIQFSTKKQVLGCILKVAKTKIASNTHNSQYFYPWWPMWVWKTHEFP